MKFALNLFVCLLNSQIQTEAQIRAEFASLKCTETKAHSVYLVASRKQNCKQNCKQTASCSKIDAENLACNNNKRNVKKTVKQNEERAKHSF